MGEGEDDFVIAPDSHRRRRWWIIAAVVLVLVALGTSAWALARRSAEVPTLRLRSPVIEPAQETTPESQAESNPTAPPTPTVGPDEGKGTVSGGATATGTAGSTVSRPKRPPYIAFRLDGTVYLAREDGTRAIPLVETEGVYALSPDVRSLAYVDPAQGLLFIVDLSTQTTMTVGPARQVTPEWSPTSSWVLGVRDLPSQHGTEVVRVDRSTGTISSVGPGSGAAVSPDGSVVALTPSPGSPDLDGLTLVKNGRVWKTLKAPGPILDAALSGAEAYVATTSGTSASGEGVWSMRFDGGGRLLSGSRGSVEPGDFGSLVLSDDGRYLAYARIGDDGRSRASIVQVSVGAPLPIGLRRDVYPLWWAADSSALYAIEGNSWQGEQTVLVRISPDGQRESVVVQGADR